ncbi:UbiA prenyltransferase family [Penicillium capsulatum]|uniref:UbiA prenyltransferase family n=1 Tax=Penicillium capsulatum TaxID=69766 RepID=A0A9W9LH28_9EURO|nr:UbiA prenyltransferase family [Penicillium capsulatum]KAJ6105565.1 UbiA prenyltransferase family [Penicillium capsulatum]
MESLTSPGEPRIGLAEVPLVLWDFVKSDFSTFVLPSTAFGFLGALAAPKLTEFPQSPSIGALLIRAVPRTLLFNTGNLLVFDIANQRLPESVDEDSVNKPWRSLPRGRINPTQARRLLLGTVPAVLAGSAMLGVGAESGLILLLTWMYNDLGGGDELTRDPIIAVAYVAFLVSSLHIAMLSTPVFQSPGINGWG